MGWGRRLGVALSAIGGWLGLTGAPPPDDSGRLAQITEMYAGYREEFPEIAAVDAPTLLADLRRGESWVLVDVRSPAERAVSVLPGAVTSEEIEAAPEAWRGRRLAAYCTIGWRSGLWTRAQRAGGLDVVNLEGGILAWTHAGGELVGADGPTRRVHVYGPTWDLARTDYEAVF